LRTTSKAPMRGSSLCGFSLKVNCLVGMEACTARQTASYRLL
jgi:hypothetical protein